MQAPFDNIVQHLFHQPSLHSVTIGELENMAQQHPYFAAAHFLLLKKMQDTDHPQFNTQLHKTTLYFNNPLWLQFLLQPETVTNFTVSEKSPFLSNETTATTAVVEENETGNIPASAETAFQQEEQVAITEEQDQNKQTSPEPSIQYSSDANFPQAQAGIMDVITEVFNEPGNQSQQPPAVEETNPIILPEEIPGQPIVENIPAENIEAAIPLETGAETATPAEAEHEPITEENSTGVFQPAPAETVEENNGEANLQTAEIPIAVPAFTTTNETVIPPAASEPTEENTPGPLQEPAIEPVAETTGGNNDEVSLQAGEMPETAIPNEEKPLLKTMIIETAAAKNDLLFEPYHTVDYFASQGIKLSKMELDAKDKLGTKLKSFTEWLKSMKKLPQVSIDKILSENEESKVVEDAIHSIENKEVITEAMAEVFEKQGLMEKAAGVYQKLSLLNPGKSVYFAAKIEALKH